LLGLQFSLKNRISNRSGYRATVATKMFSLNQPSRSSKMSNVGTQWM